MILIEVDGDDDMDRKVSPHHKIICLYAAMIIAGGNKWHVHSYTYMYRTKDVRKYLLNNAFPYHAMLHITKS